MKYTLFNKSFIHLLLCVLLFSSCKTENEKSTNVVWEEFKNNIEVNNIDFLLENSKDSIKCIDCVKDENEKLQSSKFIFNQHLDELYSTELLKDKKYSTYKDDAIIRISYSFEDSYETIYMFDNLKGKYIFTGMITVP